MEMRVKTAPITKKKVEIFLKKKHRDHQIEDGQTDP